jgi:putative SOS response-associated peptidase YedK
MCGRATLSLPPDELREALGLDEMPAMHPRYNIAPSQPIAVIRSPRRLELLTWGLAIPHARGARGGARGINVRAETVARAPMYRDAFRHRRCIIVVDGFYEWQHAGRKTKQPFFLHREDGLPFGLAGIWDSSITPDGVVVDACAVITCSADGVVKPLHDRMPVIVPNSDFDAWLAEENRHAATFLSPHSSPLVATPVSALVNSPANDDPRCIEAVDPIEPGADGRSELHEPSKSAPRKHENLKLF